MVESGLGEDLQLEGLGDLGNKPLQCANVPHQVGHYVGVRGHEALLMCG